MPKESLKNIIFFLCSFLRWKFFYHSKTILFFLLLILHVICGRFLKWFLFLHFQFLNMFYFGLWRILMLEKIARNLLVCFINFLIHFFSLLFFAVNYMVCSSTSYFSLSKYNFLNIFSFIFGVCESWKNLC